MPFYDYQCTNNHRFELKQSFSAEPVATCPTCASTARRLINLVPVIYKGSGFYITDYARKPEPGEAKGQSEAKAEAPAAEKADKPAKAEKPAPKAEKAAAKEPAKAAS